MTERTAEKHWVEPIREPRIQGCLNAGAPTVTLAPKTKLCVRFGLVSVTRNGKKVWVGDDEDVTIYRFTRRAIKEPQDDWRVKFDAWRVEFNAALSSQEYQFQEGKWVLISQGMGFA